MKMNIKSTGTPLDEIGLGRLKDSKRADFATMLALREFEKDNDVAASIGKTLLQNSQLRKDTE